MERLLERYLDLVDECKKAKDETFALLCEFNEKESRWKEEKKALEEHIETLSEDNDHLRNQIYELTCPTD